MGFGFVLLHFLLHFVRLALTAGAHCFELLLPDICVCLRSVVEVGRSQIGTVEVARWVLLASSV